MQSMWQEINLNTWCGRRFTSQGCTDIHSGESSLLPGTGKGNRAIADLLICSVLLHALELLLSCPHQLCFRPFCFELMDISLDYIANRGTSRRSKGLGLKMGGKGVFTYYYSSSFFPLVILRELLGDELKGLFAETMYSIPSTATC